MIESFISSFSNIEFTYSTIIVILSFSLIISTLEELVVFPVYRDTGLFSWKVSKLRSPYFLKNYLGSKLSFILSESQFHTALYIRLILSILLLFTPFFKVFSPVLILVIFALQLLNLIRSPFGLDGAYQMNLVVLLGLSIATLSGTQSAIASVCLWFIAGELILSYFIAGSAKLISPIWRHSHALPAIFSTKVYGHEGIFNLVMKNKIISVVLCWPTFVFEVVFVLALFSGKLCFFLCLIGFCFHLFNAVFMGLNTFFFSFLSTYPAIFYCCSKIKLL